MDMQIRIIKNSKRWITLSLLVIIISLGGLFMKGLNYGIDFSGGSMFQLRFEKPITLKELNPVLLEISEKFHKFNPNSSKVQVSDGNDVIIRTQEISEAQKAEFLDDLKKFGKFQITREDKVGASVGAELKRSAILALAIGAVMIVGYITMRFEFRFAVAAIMALLHDIIIAVGGIALLGYEIDTAFIAAVLTILGYSINDFRFAVAAIMALLHDIIIAVGGIALLGYEIDTAFIAAVLTILGYSINDTIVVFDRIRETLKRKSDLTFGELLDKSINQVIIRSINTSVTTLLAVLAVLLFGGDSLRTFITTLLIGILAGTYSSIFIATPLIYLFEKDRDGKVDHNKYIENEEDENHEKIVV